MKSMTAEHEALVLDSLLEKVRQYGGYDFRNYKRGTVTRRLEKRLHVTGTRTYLEYIQFLDDHPEEYQRLADNLTIKVSGFFRSPYTFQQVARLVLPELVTHKRKQGEPSLRFWSTACARGEEPYSIAILLAESLGHEVKDFDISIYASDINRQALGEAQVGVYSSKDIEGLTADLLENYFAHHSESYVVSSNIRQMVSFSYFDLASGTKAPLADLDCIFCCNIMIYLQTQLQEKVLGMLYDSLAAPGYLILGEAETPPSDFRQKLECLDSKAKIYKKNGGR